MDRLAENQFKLNVTKNEMKKFGFKFDLESNGFVYRFPVYKYKGIPLIFCKLGVDEETNRIWFDVRDANNSLYAPYYEKNSCHKNIVEGIDNQIEKELKRIGAKKVN